MYTSLGDLMQGYRSGTGKGWMGVTNQSLGSCGMVSIIRNIISGTLFQVQACSIPVYEVQLAKQTCSDDASASWRFLKDILIFSGQYDVLTISIGKISRFTLSLFM